MSPFSLSFVAAKNNLRGSLPPQISLLPSLRELYLNNNTLTGSFPETLGSLHISELDVEGNQMSGNPFDVLTRIAGLSRLRISRNRFEGGLPASIAGWERMVEFWLAENRFSGPLPPQIGELLNLQSLFVYGNSLTGELPVELGNLRLFAFQAQENRFWGSIPVELFNNVNLIFLRLDVNELTGNLPGSFGRLTELRDLRLANNSFTGNLPATLFGLNRLRKYST